VLTVPSNGLFNDHRSISHSFSLRDYTEFLEDLEEDPVLRQNVNVYKGKSRLRSSIISFWFF
jgi:hypothetical protein